MSGAIYSNGLRFDWHRAAVANPCNRKLKMSVEFTVKQFCSKQDKRRQLHAVLSLDSFTVAGFLYIFGISIAPGDGV